MNVRSRYRFRKQMEKAEEDVQNETEEKAFVPARSKSEWVKMLNEIKEDPTPKGMYPAVINGDTYDLHDLEEYIMDCAPIELATIMRYNNARLIGTLKGVDKLAEKNLRRRY